MELLSTTIQRNALDVRLADILTSQLGSPVRLCDVEEAPSCAAVQDAMLHASTAHVQMDGDTALIVMLLPGGSMALWEADARYAFQSANHANAVVELERSRNEIRQLRAESDALANQVVDDFEGFALIRSLGSPLALPKQGSSIGDWVHQALRPLAGGIGAVSVAAVLLSVDGDEFGEVIWSDEPVLSNRALQELIGLHCDEASTRPVVRNKGSEVNQVTWDGLNEFILVQCGSESRLHGWLIACNQVALPNTRLPWAQLGFSTVQASLLETATDQLAAQLHNMRLLLQKEELFTDVVRALVNAVEARDRYTSGHSERVARFSRCLALAGGETPAGCERIYLTGLLHDVGKIAIPDEVLQKPGKLNEKERAIIETHTEAGWRILHELEALRDVLPGVLYHHERYDGKGYPDGLIGENIPKDGRILAVCDAFDAMTSDRPYRKGMSTSKAIEILRRGSGTHWDPELIELFIDNVEAIDAIRLQHCPRPQSNRPAPVDGRPVLTPAAVSPTVKTDTSASTSGSVTVAR